MWLLYQHVLLTRVPQGQQWGVLHNQVLSLVIQLDAPLDVRLGASLLQDRVQLRVRVGSVVLLALRVEQDVQEVLRVRDSPPASRFPPNAWNLFALRSWRYVAHSTCWISTSTPSSCRHISITTSMSSPIEPPVPGTVTTILGLVSASGYFDSLRRCLASSGIVLAAPSRSGL